MFLKERNRWLINLSGCKPDDALECVRFAGNYYGPCHSWSENLKSARFLRRNRNGDHLENRYPRNTSLKLASRNARLN